MTRHTHAPRIRADRLIAELAGLARFGARHDGGVDRLAGSAADIAARRWLADRVTAWGGLARHDELGSVFGRTRSASTPRLLIGSHSDTVPAGGRLDGAYGVVAAWEVLRTLVEDGHPAADRVEVVSFWDEEGASPTSPGGLTGSTALCSHPEIEDVAAFLELHIEQGPRMAQAGWELAVVSGIVAIERHLFVIEGEANHAGTTPMADRVDAGRAAATLAVQVREVALRHPEMVANVGALTLDPGAPNVIPGRASVLVEVRGARPQLVESAVQELAALAQRAAGQHGCRAHHRQVSRKPLVRFDPALRGLAGDVLRHTGRPYTELVSYAGHDAGAISAVRPSVMLFVPSVDGISHSPRESTPDPLLAQGAQALLDLTLAAWQAMFDPDLVRPEGATSTGAVAAR